MIDYSPLWTTLKEKNMSQYDLLHHGIDKHIMDSLRHNRNITLMTLGKICKILDCTPNDVVRFNTEKDR